ncbi:hypothetical protein BKA64DRAFT_748026 [Cadophora sp. MPI-SDFR-AT-0126]|nr:hypothetical protein BKA64DRAFT_748026 [Leotiomycetes sp. MPI-SDFR-AT-0126]
MDAALVTGCSEGGLGEGIVRAFVDEGIHVFATARSLSSIKYLKDLPNTTLIELDVTSPGSISATLESVKSYIHKSSSTSPNSNSNSNSDGNEPTKRLRLKYLINNAGLGLVKPVLDGQGIADVERNVFETNVWGPLALIRAIAPLMISSPQPSSAASPKSPKPPGTAKPDDDSMVINITSGAAIVPLVWNGVYAASKAAMFMLSETMRLELEPLGVRTQSVVVGIVRTRFHENLKAKAKVGIEVSGEDEIVRNGDGNKHVDVNGRIGERFHLAEGSFYTGIRGVLRDEASGKVQDESVMSAGEAGRRIVRDAVRGKKGRTYVGTKAGVLSIVGVLPRWLVDSIVRKMGQLDKFVSSG